LKNLLIALTFLFSMTSFAQTTEIRAGAGSGAFYFTEEADKDMLFAYDSPASLYFDVTHHFKDRMDGIKLRIQSTSVHVVGKDYQTGIAIDGTVEFFITSLLYECIRADKMFNIGCHLGMGLTQREFKQQKNTNWKAVEARFMSITFGGAFSLRLHEKPRLILETALLWTDPITTLRGSENWQTVGEDISFPGQMGISYRFKQTYFNV
jgi:hypothetical protein